MTTTRDFGSVEYNGLTLALIEEATISNYRDHVRYYARAKDASGNTYRVAWDTTEAWDAGEYADRNDEADACDWGHPVAAELIEEAA